MAEHQESPSSFVDKLERQLAKLLPADKNIIRRKKNGDLIYETVRVGRSSGRPDSNAAATAPVDPSPCSPNSNFLPTILPQTPMNQEIGNQIDDSAGDSSQPGATVAATQTTTATELAAADGVTPTANDSSSGTAITCHEAPNAGNQESTDPLTELLQKALAATKTRGRPPAFDDHARGQLVALLSVGMSMRQAASVLGVSHTTVQNTLKANPDLAEQITAARFQAQLQPLACVIREARRSWKAATWLLKYLDSKFATHEETPDERRDR